MRGVRLQVETLMAERLIRRAHQEGIIFFTITHPDEPTLILETSPRNAVRLQALCQRFSLPCRVLEHNGSAALMARLKRRVTLLAGILAGLVCVALFLSRIWLIDIETADGADADFTSLHQTLASLNIRPGIGKNEVNPELLANLLSASTDTFSFVGVRQQGVRLLIEVAPAVPEPQLYPSDMPQDLLALHDGIIESVNVQAGLACVEPGDTVLRGQLLIRGEERTAPDAHSAIAARGSVVARTWCTGEASASLMRQIEAYTGRSSVHTSIDLAGLSWPLETGERYSSQAQELETVPIVGLYLPLELHRNTFRETKSTLIETEKTEMERALTVLALAEARVRMAEAYPDTTIPTRIWTQAHIGPADTLNVRAVFEIHSDVATTRDILIQQGG